MNSTPTTVSTAALSDSAIAAIEFAVKDLEGLQFLRAWLTGQFDVLRKEWPEAPEAVYIGADPCHPDTFVPATSNPGRGTPLFDVVLTAHHAVLRAITSVSRWQYDLQFKGEGSPSGKGLLSVFEANLREACETLKWAQAQLTGTPSSTLVEIRTSLKACYQNVLRAEMHLLNWELANPQQWRKTHDVALVCLGQAIETLAVVGFAVARDIDLQPEAALAPATIEPAGWREFIENIAKPRSEPLNSVCAYGDKQSRKDKAMELRARARELLVSVSTSTGPEQATAVEEQSLVKQVSGSYGISEVVVQSMLDAESGRGTSAGTEVSARLNAALLAAQTGHGSYGPNYDGHKLAAAVEAVIAHMKSGDTPQ